MVLREHTDFIFRDWQRYGELLDLLESDRLAKAISRLKDRDREILFARVYGELTFAELGDRFHEDCYGRWKSGVITAKEAMTLTGLKKDSFYRLAKKYESERCL
ncbi:hypothetical protein NSB25_25025 [Acetatifactor muris]|jgi:hypothetical protein|uniref:Uncharacterized protein n=1 Tax=Acetatifactor muris TaxID=879566 RepID=A0A2K4ZNR3_9FIRM|nr:hypothetical protein [Acetatifactor muris]MCI8801629.1 hypothetical protein [Lachnospiraceae bacterium]MCR2050500.1 hypothetical protein [Acetatifactor muris]SOY32118.1 hypothetical protein AMURIS_04871 [Acetatifactor muris]